MAKETLSKDQAKVTEAESKNIMDDILGELDEANDIDGVVELLNVPVNCSHRFVW